MIWSKLGMMLVISVRACRGVMVVVFRDRLMIKSVMENDEWRCDIRWSSVCYSHFPSIDHQLHGKTKSTSMPGFSTMLCSGCLLRGIGVLIVYLWSERYNYG